MKDYKIFTFDEILDIVRLPREAWRRVEALPKEEQREAIRRELSWPEGFLEHLKGKPLEEQMRYYRIVEEEYHSRTAYGSITKSNQTKYGYPLEKYSGLTALIVEDGVLIGVRMECFGDYSRWGAAVFPYQTICTYYASDNEGSGSKDREDYAHLCCVIPE